jgi:steroid delta-isomerase-like uncharacterized protein
VSQGNKEIIRRLYAEIDEGDLDIVDELWAPDHVFHMPGSEPMDRAAHKALLRMYQGAFGDWHQEITDMVAEEDRVVTVFTFHATHRGEFMGIPPTGNRVEVMAVAIERLGEGRIVEGWTLFDGLGMLRQLGSMPAPA